MPENDCPGPVPGLGTFMAEDTTEGTPRLGKVTAWDGNAVHLRPPGGGTVWTAAPSGLRRPTDEERALIRILTSPVTASGPARRARQTCPEPPVVLSVDLVPPAVPAPGCATCALAADWERYHLRTHDQSAAADFRIEMRNHPHTEPKLTLPADPPERP
ncbi:hypothetical protein [Streptomyces globisporus]|uniref:hypothetical protein n=1 Tax=Streptomyces globisporus TaxID=1908 RepID=UPI00068B6920|nr:hypothetical protein [Streptomyces globisporus]